MMLPSGIRCINMVPLKGPPYNRILGMAKRASFLARVNERAQSTQLGLPLWNLTSSEVRPQGLHFFRGF
jgi:hypothetical protein